MEALELGLRDRKRLQTRTRMEHAAVDLALRDGLQHATVDAICEAADVSPRTFFNYFESKEDAILGFSDMHLPDTEAIAQSLARGETALLNAIIGMIVEMATPALENRSLHEPRTELLRRNPDLFTKQIARLTRISDDVVIAVQTLMSHDPRFLAGAASPLAELILALCTSAVRASAKEWIAAGSDAPIDDIRIRAIALAREAVEKLT